MIVGYYTQHRHRAARPEHRVRVFFRPLYGELGTPDHSMLIGTLELDTATGKVTCDPEAPVPYVEEVTGPGLLLLGELWAWAEDAMPQVVGL